MTTDGTQVELHCLAGHVFFNSFWGGPIENIEQRKARQTEGEDRRSNFDWEALERITIAVNLFKESTTFLEGLNNVSIQHF